MSFSNPMTSCCVKQTSIFPKADFSKDWNEAIFSVAFLPLNVEKNFLSFSATRLHPVGPAPPNFPIYLSSLTLLL